MLESPTSFSPGDPAPTRASWWRALYRACKARLDVHFAAPLESTHLGRRRVVRLGGFRPFPAEVAGAGPSYAYTEKVWSGGIWNFVPSARTGSAVELKGVTGLAGSVQEIKRKPDGTYYFVDIRVGPPCHGDTVFCVKVVDGNGPVSGRAITVLDTSNAPYASGTTDASGCYCVTIPQSDWGTYHVSLDDGNCGTLTATGTVSNCQSIDVVFRLCCWKVCLQPASGGAPCCEGWTEAGGASMIPSVDGSHCPTVTVVPPGPRSLTCQNAGHWPVCDDVQPVCGEEVTVTATDYPVSTYALNLCCGSCTNSRDRSAVVPRRLYATFTGPRPIFGDFAGASIPLDLTADSWDGTGWDPVFGVPPGAFLHWTATLGAPNIDWFCWQADSCYDAAITDPYCRDLPPRALGWYKAESHPWTGARVDVWQSYRTAPDGGCSTLVLWQLLGMDFNACSIPIPGPIPGFPNTVQNDGCASFDCAPCGAPDQPSLVRGFMPVAVKVDSNGSPIGLSPDWRPVGLPDGSGGYKLCGVVDYTGGDGVDAGGLFPTVGGAQQWGQGDICGGTWSVTLSE